MPRAAWCGGSTRGHSKGDGPRVNETQFQPGTPGGSLGGNALSGFFVYFWPVKNRPPAPARPPCQPGIAPQGDVRMGRKSPKTHQRESPLETPEFYCFFRYRPKSAPDSWPDGWDAFPGPTFGAAVCQPRSGQKPPLCKGRWHGVSRVGGIDPTKGPVAKYVDCLTPHQRQSPSHLR